MRVGAFRSIDRIGERFDFGWRCLLQTPLICRWQTEPEPNAQFIQERFDLGFTQLRRHVGLLVQAIRNLSRMDRPSWT